uniref:Uncharacterized protein n=1 Tax=Panstrongylus lignarius TaxID=156445 RepID=A0A224Y070_9HEMI
MVLANPVEPLVLLRFPYHLSILFVSLFVSVPYAFYSTRVLNDHLLQAILPHFPARYIQILCFLFSFSMTSCFVSFF